ncbi:MAG: FtsX-like permease family protein [Clostridia bacterium]|nr:FtsX-like permease family protein [Clostridia bacterium]
MLVSIRNGLRLVGVALILLCAAFVCTLFLTYRLDLAAIRGDIEPGIMQTIYDAQLASSNVVLAVTSGCLLATSIVVLCFYVQSYVERCQQQLGVLKALGYSDWELASHFWVFGLSALLGGAMGTLAAFVYLPVFAETMNADRLLPELAVKIHPELLWWTAAAPGILLAAAAVLQARRTLRRPVPDLLRGLRPEKSVRLERRDLPFLSALRQSVRRTKKALLFFIFIGGFSFACMMQMAPSMRDLASESMALMMFVIGLVLACTAVIVSAKSAVRARRRTLILMHALGYSRREQAQSVLGVYRPFAYAGFAVGTVYQYVLLKLMVDVIYRDFPGMPAYSFDLPVCLWVLLAFAVFYELCTAACAREARHLPVRILTSD